MFSRTSTAVSPWVVVRGNSKKRARLESIRYVLNQIDYEGRGATGVRIDPDPEIVRVITSHKDPAGHRE